MSDMAESMQIPAEWLREAGVLNFTPTGLSYRCIAPHVLLALADIEPVLRTKPLDSNGFAHHRMIRVLIGIRDGAALPPVPVERIEQRAPLYRMRDGTHRFYASLILGFSHVPVEICEPY
jgi:hypothetical protein